MSSTCGNLLPTKPAESSISICRSGELKRTERASRVWVWSSDAALYQWLVRTACFRLIEPCMTSTQDQRHSTHDNEACQHYSQQMIPPLSRILLSLRHQHHHHLRSMHGLTTIGSSPTAWAASHVLSGGSGPTLAHCQLPRARVRPSAIGPSRSPPALCRLHRLIASPWRDYQKHEE